MIPVNLTKRVLTTAGLRYCPVVMSANGRVKPDVVWVHGGVDPAAPHQEIRIEEKHKEGAYYIEWYEGSKRKRLSVGKDAAQAHARMLRKQAELNALSQGIPVATNGIVDTGRLVDTAISDFIDETRLSKKPKTLAAYRTSLLYFKESLDPGRTHLEDLTRLDMLKFSAFLRDTKKLTPRTCWNKFSNVMSFLKAQGIKGLVKTGDWPKYTEEEPEAYDKKELDKLFAVCDSDELLWYSFFLMTGMREQEVMHCEWSDVNFEEKEVTVRSKPQYGFTTKNYKERAVPVPPKLTNLLKAAKRMQGCSLLFPTSGCKPKLNFLDDLKAVALRAKLNPENFWLHKFRATFATWHLQNGVDLKTVQKWLGQTDLESTMRYLKAARGEAVRAKVASTFA
jgi:integrase/recombinase XerD